MCTYTKDEYHRWLGPYSAFSLLCGKRRPDPQLTWDGDMNETELKTNYFSIPYVIFDLRPPETDALWCYENQTLQKCADVSILMMSNH